MVEFIDTYSDDQITLNQARIALLTHPLIAVEKDLTDASFCRLLIVSMIGSVELMLKNFLEKDKNNILKNYFAENVKNGDRVHSLRSAFQAKGINVKDEVFNKYLAAKYLRNTIVHASWDNKSGKPRQYEIDWIEKCGFPTDTRKFSEKDLMNLEWINQNMMLYIMLATEARQPRPHLKEVGLDESSPPDVSGVLTTVDWRRAHWHNLERICSKIDTAINNALISDERFIWTNDLTKEQISELTSREIQKANYTMALKAAKEGCELLTSLVNHGDDAALSWRTYYQLNAEFNNISPEKITDALKTFERLHKEKRYPRGMLPTDLILKAPQEVATQMLELILGDTGTIEHAEIIQAISTGETAYYLIQNVTPLKLFAIQLPIISSARLSEWIDIFQNVKAIWCLGRSWYSYVENRCIPDFSYAEFCQDMTEYLGSQKSQML